MDLETKRNALSAGLEFLGMALLEYGQMSAETTEKCGCLLLCLSEYAQSLEE